MSAELDFKEAKRIFDEAVEMPPAERTAFLERICASNMGLREHIESMLHEFENSNTATELPLAPGAQLGRYRIEQAVGAGGMGAVYRAWDSSLGRSVAVKLLRPELATRADFQQRFQREARTLAQLNHPNICTIHDLGPNFLVMEWLPGETLKEKISGGPLPLEQALDVVTQVGRGIAVAHKRGILHRDIKPANIIVLPQGEAKVMDFGLAKLEQDSTTEVTASLLTLRGTLLGTPSYMSPEQARGENVDGRSDIWALGVVLYEIVTGKKPFQGENGLAILRSILDDEPKPPSAARTGLPRALDEVIAKVLNKHRAARYQHIEDLLADVELVRRGKPVSISRHRRLTRRQAIWLGGVAAASAASGVTAWKLWLVSSQIRSLAVLPFGNTAKEDDAEFLCDGLTDNLIRQIATLRALKVKRGGIFKGKIVDPQVAGRQLGVDAIMTGSVTRRSGKLYISAEFLDVRTGVVLWSGVYDRDQPELLLIQDEIASAVIDQGLRLKLSAADRRGLVRHATNDPEANELYMRAVFYEAKQTEANYLTARKFLLQAIEKDKKFAHAFAELARNYTVMALDGYARPAETWPMVKLFAENALVLDPTLLEAHTLRGAEAFWNQWNWTLAEQEFKIGFPSVVHTGTGQAMGYIFERWAVGRPGEALQLIRNVRAMNPLDLAWKLKEADLLLQMGQPQRASGIYEEIIRDARDDPRAYFGLAEVRSAQGQFDDAIAQLRLGYQALGEMDHSLLELLAKARGADGYFQADKAGAQLELDTFVAHAAANQYVSPLDFARAHARLGHMEQAFAHLNAAFAERAPGLVLLKVDHAWDPIRNDQRFRDAVKKVGLP